MTTFVAIGELLFYLQSCYRGSDDIGLHIDIHIFRRIRFNRVHLGWVYLFFSRSIPLHIVHFALHRDVKGGI